MYLKYKWRNSILTLSGGSLGLWVDEERSKLRVDMWTAGHMNIDILNANCGPYWFVSLFRSCMDHTWLRVVRLFNKNCLFFKGLFFIIGCFINNNFFKKNYWYHLEISNLFWYTKSIRLIERCLKTIFR